MDRSGDASPEDQDVAMRSLLQARLRQIKLTRESAIFLALLLGASVIRLPLMTFRGYYSDLATYINWGTTVTQHFTSIYTTTTGGGFGAGRGPGGFGGGFGGGADAGINYPPGTPYLFGALVSLYNHLLLPGYHTALTTLVRSDGAGPFIAKIPLLLADIAATVLLYRQARRRHSAKFALIAAASFAFSPALLYDGAIWGQTDGLVALPVLVALFAILDERYVLGGISLTLAVLIKPQPIIFVPLVLLYLWRWRSRRDFIRFTVAGAVTLLIGLFPILVPHFQIFAMLHNIQQQSYNSGSRITSDAFNFWWLIGYSQQTIGSTLLGINSGIIGDLLFGAVTVLCGYQIWQHREPITLFLGLAVQLFGFFMFMGGQHERYLFLFVPLLLASVIVAQRAGAEHLTALYSLGTALCFLNMLVGVGGGTFATGQVLPFLNVSALSALIADGFTSWAFLISLTAFVTFIYALNVLLKRRFLPLEPASDQTGSAPLASAIGVRYNTNEDNLRGVGNL